MSATLTTHSTLCETTREILAGAIAHVREEGLRVPREVLAINLRKEEQDANVIARAIAATSDRIVVGTYSAMDNLDFHLSEALAEVTREPARGGRSKAPTWPNGHPEAGRSDVNGIIAMVGILSFVVFLATVGHALT